MGHLISILVPVFNERPYVRRCIGRVLSASLAAGIEREVIVVDDGSTDGSADVIRALCREHPDTVLAIFNDRNRGKGACLRQAIEAMHGQYAVFQDADLEYDPSDYAVLLEPLLKGYADVVYGSRFGSRAMRRVLNYHHALANHFLTHLSNFFTGLNLTDVETGYKAFRADVLKTIPLRSNRFTIEPEITAKVAKRNCVVYEVAVSYHGRSYLEGKKIRWKDALAAIFTILKYWAIDDCFEKRYGQEILTDLSRARRFNIWIAQTIEPWLGDRILEIGSGMGNTSRFLPKREQLTVSDADQTYLHLLEDAYRHNDLVDVRRVDLTTDADFEPLAGAYDTVVCLNVLEHIDDDLGALKRMSRALAPGGRLILVVPQYRRLYGAYDKALGHCRRYERGELREKMAACGLHIDEMRSFNALATAGWWLNSCLLGCDRMGRLEIKLFDMLVPVMKVVERMFRLPGLSLVCVGSARREAVPKHAGPGEEVTH